MRRYRTERLPEPWIERLIQNYGAEQRERSVRAHVVGVSDLTDSQRTNESDACMLFLSDGTMFIPAVLSAAAWELMQELEERDTFSGLDNTTVSVQKFQLKFHMDPELANCQFYLCVNQIVTVSQVNRHHRPPSCTMLLSVRQQILNTWRSLMKESSDSQSQDLQSGLPLSCLMGEWHNDIIMNLLNDAIKKISVPTMGQLGMATPTNWHRERLHCRDEECFSTPVSHLLIPEEQRKMLTADPGVSSLCETPSSLAPPQVAESMEKPIATPDLGGDSPAAASNRLEDRQHVTLNNTRAEVSFVGGEEAKGGRERGEHEDLWDEFHLTTGLLNTRSSSDSRVKALSQPGSRSLFTNSSLAEESGVTVPPFQRPHPSPLSPAHASDPITPDLHQEPQTPSPLTSGTYTAVICVEEQSPTDAPQAMPRHVSHTPPTKKRRVHLDGSRFSYTYEPCPNIALALSRCKVPEHLVQWAVSYLGTPQHALISSGVEPRKVAMSK